ncbi:MAG: MOSC domain-containing protein, partial [Chloroflexota bacterium]|nr:MOSC domain-containing protein [Chloroflexota bacterium]
MSTKETKITHIFLKTAHGAPMEPVGHATAITGEGLQKDVSSGRTRRQVLIVDAQTIKEFGLSPGALRENIILEGQGLSGAQRGTIIKLGATKLEVTLDCAPCDYLDDI